MARHTGLISNVMLGMLASRRIVMVLRVLL